MQGERRAVRPIDREHLRHLLTHPRGVDFDINLRVPPEAEPVRFVEPTSDQQRSMTTVLACIIAPFQYQTLRPASDNRPKRCSVAKPTKKSASRPSSHTATASAMVAGMVPMALGLGEGGGHAILLVTFAERHRCDDRVRSTKPPSRGLRDDCERF